jgi:putative ABC transport system permease protein
MDHLSATRVIEHLISGIDALGRYRLRSALSGLGVMLGVGVAIATMAVNDGARREALKNVELLGLNNIVIHTQVPAVGDGQKRPLGGLTIKDALTVRQLVPLITAMTPVIQRTVTVAGPLQARTTTVVGVLTDYARMHELLLDQGRFVDATDDRIGSRVCIVGGTLAKALFGYQDPVGDHIRMSGIWYRVVGVFADRNAPSTAVRTLDPTDINQTVFVPLAALLERPIALAPEQPVDAIWVHVENDDRVTEAGGAIEQALVRMHPAQPDYAVTTPRELLDHWDQTQRIFSIVSGTAAALLLLLGAIGVMNVMFTAVLERTREIGLRRAVGATRRNILAQFIVEASVIALCGGFAGVITGMLLSSAITWVAGWATVVSLPSVAVALLIAILVGIVSGLYPAIKAARTEPITAVMHE